MSPIRGSFRDDKSLDPLNIEAMCHETTRDSVEQLKKEVAKLTPVDTSLLKKSWETTETTKPYPNHYKAKVENHVEYARIVEYGSAPHEIASEQGLAFNGMVADSVSHPGYQGRHMASRGAAYFEQNGAERIAKRNARKYLT